MATVWPDPSRTTINRVRITGNGEEPQSLALRTERLLATAQLDAKILPPAAILVVRTLRDPLPGKWRLPRSTEAYAPPAWQQAVTSALEQASRSAARPIDGAVGATAQAVVFADFAELLACLALDWLDGSLLSQWWWQSLLAELLKQGVASALLSTWLKTAHAVPAALHLLALRHAAGRFVQALPDGASQSLTTAVAETFGLSGVHIAITDHTDPDPQQAAPWMAGLPAPAPWTSWAPEAASSELSLSQATLLGIGLGLQRAPGVVRSATFAREVAAWIATPEHDSIGQPITAGPSQIPQHGVEAHQVESESTQPPGRMATGPRPRTVEKPSDSVSSKPLAPRSDQVPPSAGHGVRSGESVGAPQPGDEPLDGSTGDVAVEPVPVLEWLSSSQEEDAASTTQAQPLSASQAPESKAPVLAEPVEGVVTGYGGVFYLVNLGLYLGLYGDFSTPLQPGLELNIYDFIALVAASLTTHRSELLADPVWPLLARLAGRNEEDPPGAGFTPPDGLSLDAWLDPLLATIRERLHRALGTSADDPAEVSRLLLAHRARVMVTPVRLDVYFSLDEHPIEIRLSGLDRDPGWVPAAGRVVTFHFE